MPRKARPSRLALQRQPASPLAPIGHIPQPNPSLHAPRQSHHPAASASPRAADTEPTTCYVELLHPKSFLSSNFYSLAAFRIAIGAIVLFDLVNRLPHLQELFGANGLWNQDMLMFSDHSITYTEAERMVNPYFIFDSDRSAMLSIMAVHITCAILFLVGYFTKYAAVVTWYLSRSLLARNQQVADKGDYLLCILQFWAIWCPLSRVWSLDCRLRPQSVAKGHTRSTVCSLPVALLMLQMPIVYFMSGVEKLTSSEWSEGFMVYYSISGVKEDSMFSTRLERLCAEVPHLFRYISAATIGIELVGPLILICPLASISKRVRLLTLASFQSMQIGFLLLLNLFLFPFISFSSMIMWFPLRCWTKRPNASEQTSSQTEAAAVWLPVPKAPRERNTPNPRVKSITPSVPHGDPTAKKKYKMLARGYNTPSGSPIRPSKTPDVVRRPRPDSHSLPPLLAEDEAKSNSPVVYRPLPSVLDLVLGLIRSPTKLLLTALFVFQCLHTLGRAADARLWGYTTLSVPAFRSADEFLRLTSSWDMYVGGDHSLSEITTVLGETEEGALQDVVTGLGIQTHHDMLQARLSRSPVYYERLRVMLDVILSFDDKDFIFIKLDEGSCDLPAMVSALDKQWPKRYYSHRNYAEMISTSATPPSAPIAVIPDEDNESIGNAYSNIHVQTKQLYPALQNTFCQGSRFRRLLFTRVTLKVPHPSQYGKVKKQTTVGIRHIVWCPDAISHPGVPKRLRDEL